jgi:hypothetical protein
LEKVLLKHQVKLVINAKHQRCQIKFFENCQKELKNCQICRQSLFSPNLAIKFPFFAISTYYFTKQKWAKAKNRQMAIFAIEIPMVATEAQKSPKWRKIAKSGTTGGLVCLSSAPLNKCMVIIMASSSLELLHQSLQCGICKELVMAKPAMTPCGHLFCR